MASHPPDQTVAPPKDSPPRLLGLDDAARLTQEEITSLHEAHLNSGLVTLLRMGNFQSIRPVRAEGPYIYTEDGRDLLDCVSSYGALNLGHNHPRLVAAKQRFLSENPLQLSKELLTATPAILARNLAALTPGGLQQVFFCNSGTEAVEGALKLAERATDKKRELIIYTTNSLHGKTRGALSVTGRDKYRGNCRMLDHCIEVPYGDIGAIEAALRENRKRVAAIILEPIQGEAGIIPPPAGYLPEVADLCRKSGTLLILDEVQTGFGRTGKLFACEHEEVVPDILCLAKSLGGGMVPIGAYITTRQIHQRAYGKINDCLIHTSTFGGMSESCAVAIEAVNTVVEEGLPARAVQTGARLKARLERLKEKYPEIIADVRGVGLMLGIEFQTVRVRGGVPPIGPAINKILKGYFPALLSAHLLAEHGLLTSFTLNNTNVMRIYPSLLIGDKEIDRIADALDQVLEQGLEPLVRKGLKRAVSSAGLSGIWSWLTHW